MAKRKLIVEHFNNEGLHQLQNCDIPATNAGLPVRTANSKRSADVEMMCDLMSCTATPMWTNVLTSHTGYSPAHTYISRLTHAKYVG